MNNREQENLRELFEKFLDSEQAKQAVNDMSKLEHAINEYPAPLPDQELIDDIKFRIGRELLIRRAEKSQRSYRPIYRIAAAAAIVVITIFAGLRLFDQNSSEKPASVITASLIPTSVWENEDITEADQELTTLTAEIEQVETEMLTLKFDGSSDNGYDELAEIESELIETNNNFWKG